MNEIRNKTIQIYSQKKKNKNTSKYYNAKQLIIEVTKEE